MKKVYYLGTLYDILYCACNITWTIFLVICFPALSKNLLFNLFDYLKLDIWTFNDLLEFWLDVSVNCKKNQNIWIYNIVPVDGLPLCGYFNSLLEWIIIPFASPVGSFGCASDWHIRLVTRRSWVWSPPVLTTYFRGDWSWNIFCSHFLPSADPRRTFVTFWLKNVHKY